MDPRRLLQLAMIAAPLALNTYWLAPLPAFAIVVITLFADAVRRGVEEETPCTFRAAFFVLTARLAGARQDHADVYGMSSLPSVSCVK